MTELSRLWRSGAGSRRHRRAFSRDWKEKNIWIRKGLFCELYILEWRRDVVSPIISQILCREFFPWGGNVSQDFVLNPYTINVSVYMSSYFIVQFTSRVGFVARQVLLSFLGRGAE